MASELTVLALGCLLLLAHVILAVHYKTSQYGRDWNMGARDEDLPPPDAIAGRLDRARGNFLETFPLAIVALFGVVVAGKANETTALLAWIWLAARAIYLPIYWAGIPKIRTAIWASSVLALLGILGVLLFG